MSDKSKRRWYKLSPLAMLIIVPLVVLLCLLAAAEYRDYREEQQMREDMFERADPLP